MFKGSIKTKWFGFALICLLIFPMVMSCGGPAETTTPVTTQPPAETYSWRLQGQHASEDERWQALNHFADNLAAMSDGRITVDIYPTGALVPNEEVCEAQDKGVIEMAHPCSGYFGGLDPVFNTLPALWDFRNQWEANNFMKNKGGGEILSDAYAKFGVKYLGQFQSGDPELVYSKKPVRHVEDFKGLKIRSFGQFSWFFDELGCSTIYLPGDEIVPALATGAIDAAEWASPFSNYSVGFHEVTDYQIFPYFIWALGGCDMTMSLDLWNSLPSDVQAMVQVATDEGHYWVNAVYESRHQEYLMKMREEGPMEVITIPENEWPQIVAAAERVRDRLAAESPEAAEMIEATRAYMDELGYLPDSW
jgi:TRAP-type C4-dicarboxylate transport system substrate-binding protein